MIFLDEVSSNVIFNSRMVRIEIPMSERRVHYESDELSERGVFGRDFLPLEFFGSKNRRRKGKRLSNLMIFLEEVSSDVMFYRSNFSDRKSKVRKESAFRIW